MNFKIAYMTFILPGGSAVSNIIWYYIYGFNYFFLWRDNDIYTVSSHNAYSCDILMFYYIKIPFCKMRSMEERFVQCGVCFFMSVNKFLLSLNFLWQCLQVYFIFITCFFICSINVSFRLKIL